MKNMIFGICFLTTFYMSFANAEAETTVCGVKMMLQNVAEVIKSAKVDQVIEDFRSYDECGNVKVCLIDKAFAVVCENSNSPSQALIWPLKK